MTKRASLTCRQLIEVVADYLDGELDDFARWDCDRHLEGCASCRAYVKTYEETIVLARAAMGAAVDDAPEDLVRTVLSRVQE